MPVEYKQGPIYFHAVQSKKFRNEYDRIFAKKVDKPAPKAVKKKAKKSKPVKSVIDNC
jgi:hypothetical protein